MYGVRFGELLYTYLFMHERREVPKCLNILIMRCALHIDLKFEMVYYPECTKHLIIGKIRSLRVTPIACGLEAPKWHRKNTAFLSICFFLIRPSVVINNKDLLKTRLIFNSYAQMCCKNDWKKFLLLNTNVPLTFSVNMTNRRI